MDAATSPPQRCAVALLAAAGLCVVCACPSVVARRPTAPVQVTPTGAVEVGGLRVNYDIRFDRNDVTQLAVVDGMVLSIGRAGNLVARRLEGAGETAVAVYTSRVRCITTDTVRAIVGFEDGTLAYVDAETLRATPFSVIAGTPVWVGRSYVGKLVVVARDGERLVVYRFADDARAPQQVGHFVARAALRSPLFRMSGESTLWIGGDDGETHGALGHLDLETGAVGWSDVVDVPVRGFLESDGHVFAYGGYGGDREVAFVVEATAQDGRGAVQPVFWWRRAANVVYPAGAQVPPPPVLTPPIDVIAGAAGKAWAVAGRTLYRVSSPDFNDWTPVGVLPVRKEQPRARALLVDRGSDAMVVVTAGDGSFAVQGSAVTPLQAPDVDWGPVRTPRDHIALPGLTVMDQVVWQGDLIVATNRGLRQVDDARRVTVPARLPDTLVAALAVDTAGGLWLAGEADLWYIDGQRAVHDLSGLPGIAGRAALSMVPDPVAGIWLDSDHQRVRIVVEPDTAPR